MKGLIICAEFKSSWIEQPDGSKKLTVDYDNITCFGQSKNHPIISCIIAGAYLRDSCYDKLIEHCKTLYCRYFIEDEYNICTVEYLVNKTL